MRNPRAKFVKLLGVTQADFDAAKAALLAFLDARDGEDEVVEAAARASHALFADARVWNEAKKALGV